MKKRILIVEDVAENRMLLRDLLEFYGFEILEAADGETGVATARRELPDLILMDIQMPILDGLAAGKILKEDPATRHIKIVALTSFDMVDGDRWVRERGFDGYISKPIDTRGLSARIYGMLKE